MLVNMIGSLIGNWPNYHYWNEYIISGQVDYYTTWFLVYMGIILVFFVIGVCFQFKHAKENEGGQQLDFEKYHYYAVRKEDVGSGKEDVYIQLSEKK